jgi:hypothetical protein
MIVLFVHGMGRSPLSGWPMLRRLRKAGFKTETFGYVAALETFDSIVLRLTARLERIAETGQYIVVGHSLGGVLLRAALCSIRSDTALPRHLYLLGSPILPSRIATRLRENKVFQILAGDCGQLLGSAERMADIGTLAIPITGVAGVRGLTGASSIFGQESNDGVVSISEVSAQWLSAQIQIPIIHTWLPASKVVADTIAKDTLMRAS